jgi:hypothetical protein
MALAAEPFEDSPGRRQSSRITGRYPQLSESYKPPMCPLPLLVRVTTERAVSLLPLEQTAYERPGSNGSIGLDILPQEISPGEISNGRLRSAKEPLHRGVATDSAARRSRRYSARGEPKVAVNHLIVSFEQLAAES